LEFGEQAKDMAFFLSLRFYAEKGNDSFFATGMGEGGAVERGIVIGQSGELYVSFFEISGYRAR
jgi:hypothetical protein